MKAIKQFIHFRQIISTSLLIFVMSNFSNAQSNYLEKSKADLVTLDNKVISVSEITNLGKTVIVFLESFNDDHADYINNILSEKGKGNLPKDLKLLAICYDNQGTFKHIKPFIETRKWDFDVYIDKDRKLSNYINLEQPLLTLVFENENLVNQFYGDKDSVNANFFENRYDSFIIN